MIHRGVICIILGAVTTVAVAWGIAVLAKPRWQHVKYQRREMAIDQERVIEVIIVSRGFSRAVIKRMRHDAAGSNSDWKRLPSPIDDLKPVPWASSLVGYLESSDRCLRDIFGWPFRALYFDEVRRIGPSRARWTLQLGIHFESTQGGSAVVLPCGVYWRGFFCNTLLLTPVVAFTWLYLLPFVVQVVRSATIDAYRAQRAAERQKSGHCPQCNYDLRGSARSDRCPECGTLFYDNHGQSTNPSRTSPSSSDDRRSRET